MSAKALATVLAAGAGLMAIVFGIDHLGFVIRSIAALPSVGTGASGADIVWRIGWGLLIPVALIVLGLVLIFRPPRRLIAIDEGSVEKSYGGKLQATRIVTVGMFLIGVFLLVTAGPTLLKHLLYARQYIFQEDRWGEITSDAVQAIFGLYLFFGAPAISRWQIRRIEETWRNSPGKPPQEET